MKKWILVLFFVIILLTGCSKKIDMNNVKNEPNFSGIVEEVSEQSILVKVNEVEDEFQSSDLISVSLDVELKDSITSFSIGDEVLIYYDGNIAESYPAQINKVYAIILAVYATRPNFIQGTTIDMQGNKDFLRASLNINTGYNNELVIRLLTEEFEPPLEIFIEILAKDKSIYTNKLEKEENDNFPRSGIYKDSFDSIKDLEKNYKDISVSVTFNEQSFQIPLTSIKILE